MKLFQHAWLVACGCLFAIALMTNTGRAVYLSSDNHIPSPTYRSTNPVAYDTPDGQYVVDSFFDIFYEIDRIAPPPLQQGESQVLSFFDVFTEIGLKAPGHVTTVRESPSKQSLRLNGLPPGVPYEGYLTEMLELEISGGQLPAGVMIRESPSRPSLGQIRMVNTNPGGNGPYAIDSFFDVFTELSLDGGQTWTESPTPMRIEGGPLPEPTSSLVWLVGYIVVTGLSVCRRSR